MQKITIFTAILIVLIVGVMGFQKYNDKNSEAEEMAKLQYNIDHIEEYMESDEYKMDHPDMSHYLEVSNVKPTFSTGLYNITGQITNTSNKKIDSIGEMVIFDKDGNLITVKHLQIALIPNQTIYFEELVGMDVAGYSVKLQNFD